MSGDLLLADVRTSATRGPVALTITDGRIAAIGEPPADWTGPRIEGGGRLVLPSLVDGHAHLDKTLWGLPWRPHSAEPGLDGLIANEHAHRGALPPVAERAATLLTTYLERGTTRIRTHVDVDPGHGLAAVEGVLAAAERFTDRIHVEVVAFPSPACWWQRAPSTCWTRRSVPGRRWSADSTLPDATVIPWDTSTRSSTSPNGTRWASTCTCTTGGRSAAGRSS